MMLTGTRRTIAMLAGFAAVAVMSPALAGAQTGAVAPAAVLDPMAEVVEPGQAVKLSDETKVTRWAHATETEPIRVLPSATAPAITKLRYETEDKQPEVYLVLDGKVDSAGDQWLHIRIPMKPNGRTGWVPVDMMSQLYVVRTQLTISRSAKRATLRKGGQVIWQAPVGVGKAGTPTPTGNFWVRELLRGGGGIYGPWAFGTSAYSSIREWRGAPVVGIHGTNEPGLIPGAPSHGCVRVRNNKISQLVRLMPIGTPVRIS
jgi:lipoprotein-anchoring transpeptidase ErfK/SrfK